MVGKRRFDAARVFHIQSQPPPRDPSLGLPEVFPFGISLLGVPSTPLLPHQRRELEIIRAVRRCPIRASCTVLSCGFRHYELPAGVHKIAFSEPTPPSLGDVSGWQEGLDEASADAPLRAEWMPTAMAA